MDRKNPRAGKGARAGASIAADAPSHTKNHAARQRIIGTLTLRSTRQEVVQ